MMFSKNIKYLRLKHKLSQEDIANKLGYKNYTTVQKWESGLSEPNMNIIKSLAELFNVSLDELTSEDLTTGVTNVDTGHLIEIPLYSHISCGNGCFVEDNIEDYIKITDKMLSPYGEYFCQYAKGDSMVDENINDGDLLVFEITQSINNGQIGCFCVDHGDAVCKKFYHDKERGTVILQSANDDYDPIIITSEHEGFKVVGKLALVISAR